jgi:ATP-dependent exoDNAse (exonuclease V) beta subunit
MSVHAPGSDQVQRERALDPLRSFIVQAPAGSGKTELLIQRYLRLLATADEPEEVLAVTFTLKAAGEMRSRVVAALNSVDGPEPAEPHLRRSRELAASLLRDPRRRDWQLARHPSRLSISTIDAVNSWLAGRAPLAAGMSSLRRVSDSCHELYREAARGTLGLLMEPSVARHIEAVLEHLDGDTSHFERLIVDMLPRRDQWLRQVLAARDERRAMEKPLHALAVRCLDRLDRLFTERQKAELVDLLAYAAGQLQEHGRTLPYLDAWVGRSVFPRPDPALLDCWRALPELLLTTQGTVRAKLDVRTGFPRKGPEKSRMVAVLAECAQAPELCERLKELRGLPGVTYADDQWEVLQHLSVVLRYAAAQLHLVFAARGMTDFAAVAADALEVLGSGEAPSDVALALDHRLRHILVDEFQDTSRSQYELLSRLIEGWEPGDGRTLFLVGDPMQSIYRFRQAEVGIFMAVQSRGIGMLHPEFLQLSVNFRSRPAVVDWVNEVFSRTFPTVDDPLLGRVAYASCHSGHTVHPGATVALHWTAGDGDEEARAVARIVRQALTETADGKICILVRSRNHAAPLLAALRRSRIHFVAPEIENLSFSAPAQDLLALTRALLHPADRLAWIGVLRAPWCGLSLKDLHVLVGGTPHSVVPELLDDAQRCQQLSAQGRAAVALLSTVYERAQQARGRRSLRDLVEGAWLELGGPATLEEEAQLESASAFLDAVDAVDIGGDCPDVLALTEEIARRKGSLGSGAARVRLMTIHKAKGLEFDTVILPALGRSTRADPSPLLAWQEIDLGGEQGAVVMAPLTPTGGERDRLHGYLLALEEKKQSAEADRLLYVACTRAQRCLHLVAGIAIERDPASGLIRVGKPRARSLLAHLWPVLGDDACRQAARLVPGPAADPSTTAWVQPLIKRLPSDWHAPAPAPPLRIPHPATANTDDVVVYDWASRWAMHAGSVVHRWLQVFAEEGPENFHRSQLASLQPIWRRELSDLGLEGELLQRACARVRNALDGVLADARGRWILRADHAEAQCEMALTVCAGDGYRQLVIDRSFVTDDGCRWLIDYKTSTHEGGNLAGFIAAECERHRPQLALYRGALMALDQRPVRTALYFPILAVFQEIEFNERSETS